MSEKTHPESALSALATSPEARVQIRTVAAAVLDLAALAFSLIPLAVLRSILREAWDSYVRESVLAAVDRAIGGDGDPRDELEPQRTAAEAVEAVGSIPTQTPPAAPLRGPALRSPGSGGLFLRRGVVPLGALLVAIGLGGCAGVEPAGPDRSAALIECGRICGYAAACADEARDCPALCGRVAEVAHATSFARCADCMASHACEDVYPAGGSPAGGACAAECAG